MTIACRFSGSRAIMSGPAGGVVGYAMTSYEEETGQPVIGFDMGGEEDINNTLVIIKYNIFIAPYSQSALWRCT